MDILSYVLAKNGKGGGSGGVIPDLNENNETSAAFVKNRTHYVIPGTETRTNTLTWHGNTEGKEVVQMDDAAQLVKVSDAVVDIADIIGATVIMKGVDDDLNPIEGSFTVAAEDIIDMSTRGIPGFTAFETMMYFMFDDYFEDGANFTKGIYFICMGELGYVKSLTCLTDCFVLKTPETVVPLDGKFLPKGLGYIIKEGKQTVTNTLTWDGDTEGLETSNAMSGFYKLTEATVSATDLVGATLKIISEQEIAGIQIGENVYELTADHVQDMSASGMPAVFVFPTDESASEGVPALLIMLDDYSADGMSVTKGTWASGDGMYISSLTCLTDCFVVGTPTEVKKIDNRLLDLEWLATKSLQEVEVIPEMSVEFKQNYGYAQFEVGATGNFALDPENTYTVYYNGTKYENLEVEIYTRNDIGVTRYYIGNGYLVVDTLVDNGLPFAYEYLAVVPDPAIVGKTSLHKTTRDAETVTFRLCEKGIMPDKLPEEYLPETLLATIASLEARIAELEGASATTE